ncbi:hypothetical protein DBR17_18260 [Sphingomonas sp. HMWF008]|nr:hypothetical protein DBR17_18260 [Sphingomonas sp. HMWF008]
MKQAINRLLDSVVKRRRPGAFAFFAMARRVMWAYNNEDVNIATNGERWLLRQLGARGLVTVFDVGANVGDWVREVLDHSPTATVYCYEAIPSTFALLTETVVNQRAHLRNKALSDTPGTLDFNASELTAVSSVYDVHKFDSSLAVSKISVPAVTGDDECKETGIDRIDLLKIDTEGHDLAVLSGFAGMLSRGAVDIIQFEYNVFTLLARRGLFDFYDLLQDRFFLCRLLPNGLELMAYQRELDNFAQSNWICLRKDIVDADLVKRLGIRLPDGDRRAVTLRGLADSPTIAKLLA